ncbi:hypothetical protein LWF15_22045 [Kineosporia rhizophila]|uniref:hypothetical protein n=1 Tax=Kineosporia TaxID=49184 RepID=UPI000AD71B99|nr:MULTISPECIES: hypothetical protein [Kineosporia]MCE0538183.1 hypothetical protein [Kineosporia rhizophila]GLY15017.1 hypothetical protein Kisp01_20320 [Kineosporia sp. NBRC 101677]
MALSASEEARVISMLGELKKKKRRRILDDVEALLDWLTDNAPAILRMIADIHKLWKIVRDAFT